MKEKRHVTDKIMIIEKIKMHQNVKHLLKIYGDPRGSPGDLSKIRYGTIVEQTTCFSAKDFAANLFLLSSSLLFDNMTKC